MTDETGEEGWTDKTGEEGWTHDTGEEGWTEELVACLEHVGMFSVRIAIM